MYFLTVSEQILRYVCGLGILQGILLAGLIYFHPKGDKSVNIFLALYIFCTSAVMSLPFLMQAIGWRNSFFGQPIPLLTGPFLYFYIRSFKERITWRKAWPHFVLPVLFLFLAYWNINNLSARFPDAKGLPGEVVAAPTTMALQLLKSLQQIFYFFITRKTLLSYQRSIRQLYSETSRIDLNWARFLLYGFLVLVLAYVLIYPLIARFPQQVFLLILINMVLAVPYIYMATVKGFFQHTIWQVQPGTSKQVVEEEIIKTEEEETDAAQKTGKPSEAAEKTLELADKITRLMEHDKLYQESELTLQQLATRLEVPAYQVSLALNEGMKKSFYDLVNGHRVEEAKRLLTDPGNYSYTILSVGFEAGFNSKTTFNTVFKRFTGHTPTEYREKNKALQLQT